LLVVPEESLSAADARVSHTGDDARSGVVPSDSTLVAAACRGEPWAREAIFRRYAVMMNGIAFHLMGRDKDVDDLVQDSFVEALSNLDRLREPAALAAWLRSIVVHRAGKLIRKRRLLSRLGLGRDSLRVDPDSLVARVMPADVAVELRAIYRLVEALPAEQRIPLVLRRIEGLTLQEIASTTNTSLATVKRRLTRAETALDEARAGTQERKP
jgi:RNA polymerase sigma-70 factor, ECF subfamily